MRDSDGRLEGNRAVVGQPQQAPDPSVGKSSSEHLKGSASRKHTESRKQICRARAAQLTLARLSARIIRMGQHLLDGVDGGHGHVELLGEPAEAVPSGRPVAVQLCRSCRLTCRHARAALYAGCKHNAVSQVASEIAAVHSSYRGELQCPCRILCPLAHSRDTAVKVPNGSRSWSGVSKQLPTCMTRLRHPPSVRP